MKHSTYLRAFALVGALVFALAFVYSTPAYADNLYASIRGTVTDPSGAALPGAKLTAKNIATGLTYTATSSNDGQFSFLQLPIGDYEVSAEKSGFKKFTAGHIHLDLNQVYSLRPTMEVGTATETITVEANPAQVDTTNMQLGTTISGSQIVDLPLNGRNWTTLMQLQPGVEASSDRFGTGAYSTNGAETQQNAFLINGTDTNDTALNTPLVIPSPDAIGEFNLVTSTLNPEFGRNSGAVVNAAIKSGTNQFHGDVFEFYRDTFLDAIPWFQQTRALFHQNQFGGTIGGPIVKDHAFFFFSYQGRRAVTPQPDAFGNSFSGSAPVVFSPAQRNGDFSADTSGGPFAPPSTGAGVSPFAMVGADGVTHPAGTPYATLFPTGVIPKADLNSLSLKLMNQYVPLPNAAGNAFDFNPLETAKVNQYIYRIDERISNKDAIWFYGLNQTDSFDDALTFIGSNLPGFATSSPDKIYEYTVAWNHTFSPTMLNEARVAYLRFNFNALVPQQTQSPSAYGFTGLTSNQAPQFQQLPIMDLAGLFTLGYSDDAPQPRVQNTYQVTDNLSKVVGHHTLKLGFNMDRQEINNPFYGSLNGSYNFHAGGVFSTGDPGADFLLGIPDSFSQGSGSIIRARGREYYSYAQDQWQMKPNLTLTFGVGWDILTPYKNLYAGGKAQAAFIAGEQSKAFPSSPVGYVFPGDPGVGPYGLASIHYDNLSPRLGFAWSPGSSRNWSIRGGIGLYYNRTEEEPTLQTLADPPFSFTTLGVSPGLTGTGPGFANPYVSINPATVNGIKPASVAQSPFPFTPPAPGSSPDFSVFEPLGFNVSEYAHNLTSPRATNFNLTVERQIDKNTVASLGYVGSIGRHEEASYNINPAGQPNPVAGSYNPTALAAGCNDYTLAFCAPGTFEFNPLVYGQIGVFASGFDSNYNSLQATINRHFANGLQFQAAYTWSRNFDYTSNFENSGFNGPGFNPWNFKQNYGPSANDAPQRLVVNYVYTLPFYRLAGHRLRMLTDGWTVTGIGTFQHGFPVNVLQFSGTDLTTGLGTNYYSAPNFVTRTSAPLDIGHDPRHNTLVVGGVPTPNMWLNPAAFAVPTNGVMGNANRNPFYGPGLNFWDMALEKQVKFTESKYVELRLESFDTFNHANFANPSPYVGFPNFGEILSTRQITTNGAGRVVQLGAKIYF